MVFIDRYKQTGQMDASLIGKMDGQFRLDQIRWMDE